MIAYTRQCYPNLWFRFKHLYHLLLLGRVYERPTSRMNRPHIILVHGAHHGPSHLETLAACLRNSSYFYHVRVPQQPWAKAEAPIQALEADVATIEAELETAAAEGASEIYPVFHSHASVPGFDAIARLSAEVRARIKRTVLIAAFVLQKGTSPTTASQGRVAPWAEFNVCGLSEFWRLYNVADSHIYFRKT